MRKICVMMLTIVTSIGLPLHAQIRAATNTTPRTGFTLTISVENLVVTTDEIGSVIVKEKNVTNHLINNTRPMNPCFWYRMEILRDGVQVPKTEAMIRRESPSKEEIESTGPFLLTIEPRQEVQFEIPVDQCYDMSVPGRYQITFTWERDDLKHPNKVLLTKSNTITIMVLPADGTSFGKK
jgi:hypothetical protein